MLKGLSINLFVKMCSSLSSRGNCGFYPDEISLMTDKPVQTYKQCDLVPYHFLYLCSVLTEGLFVPARHSEHL